MPHSTFNLETAIDTWKAFFKHRPAFFQDDLEELELHLRDHIAELIQEGYSEEEAFREASSRLGNVTQLDDAFRTVVWPKIKHKKQVASALFGQLSMIRSYLKSAVRNLVKQKGYSSLNIVGLMVGLACSFLVFIWIQTQLSVDAFHENADRLYQVKVNSLEGLETRTWSNAPAPLAFHLETEFSEVEAAVLSMPIRAYLRNEDVAIREVGFFAGPAFFEAFTFPFLAGDPASALGAPGQIAISSSLASKLFGKKWQSGGGAVGDVDVDAPARRHREGHLTEHREGARALGAEGGDRQACAAHVVDRERLNFGATEGHAGPDELRRRDLDVGLGVVVGLVGEGLVDVAGGRTHHHREGDGEGRPAGGSEKRGHRAAPRGRGRVAQG